MPTPRQKLVAKFDQVFSKYVRLRAADSDGYGSCFTCGSRRHWKEVDAGHFITRAKFSTRWHELNVQFQCKQCNMNGGRQYEFGRNLDAQFGEGTAHDILIESMTTRRYSSVELQELIDHYARKVGEFKERMG